MPHPLRNEATSELVEATGADYPIVAVRGGYHMLLQADVGNRVEAAMQEIVEALAEKGLKASAHHMDHEHPFVVIEATPELDERMLSYRGWIDRISYAGPGSGVGRQTSNSYIALIDGEIVSLPGTDHVILSRDGDEVSITYRRGYDGEILVSDYVNRKLRIQ